MSVVSYVALSVVMTVMTTFIYFEQRWLLPAVSIEMAILGWWAHRLDLLADKMLISTAFLFYIWQGYLALWMVLLVAARDIMVTGLRVWAEHIDHPVVTSKEAKYKTFAQNLFAYFILLRERGFFGPEVAALMDEIHFSPWLDYVMLAITLFTVWTGVSHLVSNRTLFLRNPVGGR